MARKTIEDVMREGNFDWGIYPCGFLRNISDYKKGWEPYKSGKDSVNLWNLLTTTLSNNSEGAVKENFEKVDLLLDGKKTVYS